MKLATATTLLALANAAMAWSVTLFETENCGDNQDDYKYMVIEGFGPLPYCVGPGFGPFPDGVTCRYFWDGGAQHSDCDGQIKAFNSWLVETGNYQWWANYNDASSQPTELACSGKYTYGEGDAPTTFGPEITNGARRCRNAWYHTKPKKVLGIDMPSTAQKVYTPIRGISAWDA